MAILPYQLHNIFSVVNVITMFNRLILTTVWCCFHHILSIFVVFLSILSGVFRLQRVVFIILTSFSIINL